MKQQALYAVLVIIILIGGLFLLKNRKSTGIVASSTDYKNGTYTIEGKSVTLKNGVSEVAATPDSAAKITTFYFGNEAIGDLNNDGIADIAFVLTQNSGGSGTFYYLVGALKNANGGYVGTSGMLLGDRVAPQTTEIKDGLVIANYADRAVGESFAVAPSIAKSIWLKLDSKTMQFGEVVQNFEDEASPSVMSIEMKTWTWIKTVYSNGSTIIPKQTGAFKLSFAEGGKFSATTDCNSVGGSYTASKGKISFSNMMSTLRFCNESQEAIFSAGLAESKGYRFTSKGELMLDLSANSGTVIFR